MTSRPYKDLIIYGCFVLNRLVAEMGIDLYQEGLDAKLALVLPNQHGLSKEEVKREIKSNHPITGSTTTGMKSYVPSSRSIASSREHTNVEPRIFTRADSLVKNSYTSGVTLSSPFDRQRTRIRAGGIFVAMATSSIAAFSARRSARVGARSNAFTNTAKPAEPRLVIRHKVEDCRRTYASNE